MLKLHGFCVAKFFFKDFFRSELYKPCEESVVVLNDFGAFVLSVSKEARQSMTNRMIV